MVIWVVAIAGQRTCVNSPPLFAIRIIFLIFIRTAEVFHFPPPVRLNHTHQLQPNTRQLSLGEIMTRPPVLAICVLIPLLAHAQNGFPSFFSQNDFVLGSTATVRFGLYGYDNPALLTTLHQPDLLFTWSDRSGTATDVDRWGLFAAIPHLSLGVISDGTTAGRVADYRLSTSGGDDSFSYGIGYGWTAGDKSKLNRSNVFTLGFLVRPSPAFSLGITGTAATAVRDKQAAIDAGVRPWQNELVTIFGGYAARTGEDGLWSAGIGAEPLPGIRIVGRTIDARSFSLGLEVSFGHGGITAQSHFDESGSRTYNTYGIRLGAYDRNVFSSTLATPTRYLHLVLKGRIKYQRFRLFDDSRTLWDLLSAIDAASVDPTVGGIVLNTSGMESSREFLWELREKLKWFRSTGKHVVVFLDRPGIDEYHLASVADRIIMDPVGLLLLEGFVSGRTFFKGALEKLGIGFDEWRLFEYKSLNESLSRTHMTPADSLQRQELLETYYRVARNDIAEGRGLSPGVVDRCIHTTVLFLPEDALQEGLVDTLGRWATVEEVIRTLEGRHMTLVPPSSLARFNEPRDNRWGIRPRIAVVYALGVCALDQGIRARSLSKDIERVAGDPAVKAIVLRVDSPGGDGLASDYVAEAIRMAKEKKPVIVSQGVLAASGGYWLSMYADTIVTAPATITGSIGVAGGWLYDRGLKEKLGLSTDKVQIGDHADIGFGATLPLIGAGLPDRNLDEVEQRAVTRALLDAYKKFTTKVARGRGLPVEEVDSLGQGRVWSGADAQVRGLADVLGGLDDAVKIACAKGGISPEDRYQVIELPEPPLFDLGAISPFLAVAEKDPVTSTMKFLLENNGRPLYMLPWDMIEYETLSW
jgi:protease-4